MVLDEEIELRYIFDRLNIQEFDHPLHQIVIIDNNKVVGLRLARQGIRTLPSGIFDNLTHLRELDLSKNYLTSLPSGIFDRLPELSVIYLHNNHLSILPKHIFNNLINLKELSLHNNKLNGLPENLFSTTLELQSLNLSNNRLTDLEPSILNLKALEWIDLRKNLYEEPFNVRLTDPIKIQSLLTSFEIDHKLEL
jgi:Leucine-rich repeat (LRR) protein